MIEKLTPLPPTVKAGKFPNWNINNLYHRNCPVCNQDIPIPIVTRPDNFIVHRCSKCNMIYLADIPKPDEIYKFYTYYASFKGLKQASKFMNYLKLPKNKIASNKNFFIDILENTGGIKGCSVCDIGCSFGWFLELIRYKGGYPVGVELDNNARNILKKKGIPAFEEIDSNKKYDIICMFQLLEHLVNPSDLLKKVSSSLLEDGRVLISVPNAGEFAKIGYTWIGFRVDFEHVNYFDLHSLSNLLLKHGLIIEHFWEHNQPGVQRIIDIKKLENNIVNRSFKFVKSIIKGFLNNRQYIMQKGTFVLTVLARKI